MRSLLNFLKSNGLEFKEYFEVKPRALVEYHFFISCYLPMISATEQEIKNESYKMNSSTAPGTSF